jgi:transposase
LISNADITIDRFHVMKQVNDQLDAARKQQKKKQFCSNVVYCRSL